MRKPDLDFIMSVFSVLFPLLLGLGCSKGGQVGPHEFRIPKEMTRQEWLDRIRLLNLDGQQVPPQAPKNRAGSEEKISPFAILLSFQKDKNGEKASTCSATQISPGKVVSAAHCVDRRLQVPRDHVVVYYNKRGEKSWDEVEAIEFVGAPSFNDVALLSISKETAREWDAAGDGKNVLLDTKSLIGKPEESKEVIIWSLDPLYHYPKLKTENKGYDAMVFAPFRCKASRTKPVLKKVTVSPYGGELRSAPEDSPSRENEDIHLFIDQCERPVRHGNSGSMVTLADNFDQFLGELHWISPGNEPGQERLLTSLPDDTKEREYFEYQGNMVDGNGKRKVSKFSVVPKGQIYAVGYLFESLVTQLGPQTFSPILP